MQALKLKGGSLYLLLLIVSLCLRAQAQPGFVGRIVLNIDDPSVTAAVDNSSAAPGETVTLTLSGVSSKQSVTVTAGLSALADDYPIVQGSDNTYTFLMPSATIYINVCVKTAGNLIRVQTPGIGSSLTKVTLAMETSPGVWEPVDASVTEIPTGISVRSSLNFIQGTGYTLSLLGLTGYATDGSWTLVPIKPEGTPTVSNTVEFKMPDSDVVLRYTIGYEANLVDIPSKDGPNEPKVEVPEIVWPNNPGTPGNPVIVITKEIEELQLEQLQQKLHEELPQDVDSGAIIELVDISLQLAGVRIQPGEGESVTVTYPYPQGTDGGWNFTILHMISDDPAEPVAFETLYPQSLHIGLRFHVGSFSPFAILYTPPSIPEGGGVVERVTGVTLPSGSLRMEVGRSQTLNATIVPANATDKRMEWTSSNDGIATVSATGTITALSPGQAMITVRTLNGGFTATCRVTVSEGGGVTPPDPPVSTAEVEREAPLVSVYGKRLSVTSPVAVPLRIYDASGRQRFVETPSVSHSVSLAAGLWFVRIGESITEKIVIP